MDNNSSTSSSSSILNIHPIQHRGAANCSAQFPPMDATRIALNALEMAINALVLVISPLFGWTLARTGSFSRSLKCLLFNLLFASFTISWTRLFLIQPQSISDDTLFAAALLNPFRIVHDVCVNVNTMLQLALTLECLVSTLCGPHPLPLSSILLNGIWPWLLTLFLYVLDQRRILPTVPEFIFLEVLNLLSWLVLFLCNVPPPLFPPFPFQAFLRLYFINCRKYREIGAGNLDSKYQVTLKIRTLRTLLFLSALTSFRNFITMALLLAIILFLLPNCLPLGVLFCGHAFDLTVAIYSLCLCLPIIATHDEFKKHFKELLFGGGPRPTSMATVSRPFSGRNEPRNALGEELILAHNNPDQHFQQLAKTWDQLRPTMMPAAGERTSPPGMVKL